MASETVAHRITQGFSQEMYIRVLTYASFGLLLISCTDEGPFGNVTKLLWLLSTIILSVVSPGGAVGTYVASVAIYNVRHVQGWGSPFERPDNFAFPIVLWGLLITGVRKPHSTRMWRLILLAGVLVGYGLLQMAALEVGTRSNFAWFMRMFGLPLTLLCALIWARLPFRELLSYTNTIALLAAYIGVTCLFEAMGWYELAIPHWIADPQLNVTIGIGRVGGPLLQSEWNALALGLIYCILLGTVRGVALMSRITRYVLSALCVVSIYLTYTRAAWIALVAASFVLIHERRGAQRVALTFAAVALMGATLLFPTQRGRERLQDSNTVYFRINIWAAGLQMASDKPLFGYGFGQFSKEIAGYKGGISSLPETSLDQEGTVAHNTLVSILVEQGVIGLLLYSLVVVFVLIDARAHTRQIWPGAAALITAISLTYFINVMFVHAHEPTTNFLYYCTMGLLIGLDTPKDQPSNKPADWARQAGIIPPYVESPG